MSSLPNITISKQLRSSLSFIDTMDDDREQFINKFNVTQSERKNVRFRTAYFKVLDGPQKNIKIIVHFKYINDNKNYQLKSFIYAVNLQIQSLRFRKIYERYQENSKIIRDVILHPNNKELYIIFTKSIERYYLIKEKYNIPYGLTLYKRYELPEQVYTSGALIHPSGQYIIAINKITTNINNTEIAKLIPIKIDLQTFKIYSGESVQEKCLSTQTLPGYSKWNLAIDRNNLNFAVITSYVPRQNQNIIVNIICKWQLQAMKISYTSIFEGAKLPPYIPAYDDSFQDPNYKSTENKTGNMVITSVGYLNRYKQGFFICYQSDTRDGHIFKVIENNQINDTSPTLQYTNVMNYNLDLRSSIPAIVKCVDVYDIDAFACITQRNSYIQFFKIGQQQRYVRYLGYAGYMPQKGSDTEQVFYYQPRGEICSIYESSLQCWKIQARCKGSKNNSTLMPINQCKNICSQQMNKFWNPSSMQCEQCPNNDNCSCKQAKKSFNPYTKNCTLDCTKIKYTALESAYGSEKWNSLKCICQPPYTWFQNEKICRVNCSSIKNTKPMSLINDFNSEAQLNNCQCTSRYRYVKKLDSFDIAGRCMLICKNGRNVLYQNDKDGEQYCQCQDNQQWNWNKYQCVKVEKSLLSIPGWAIALIVIGALLLLLAIGFFVRKKILSKKQQQSSQIEQDMQSTSRRMRKRRRSKRQNIQSHQNIKNPNVCVICNNENQKANCKGPCDHYFHFNCVTNRFQLDNYQCPQCKMLINGISQLQMIE